jgi:hypothetical protein
VPWARGEGGGPDRPWERDTAFVEPIGAQFGRRKLFAGQIEMPLLSIARPQVVLISTEDRRQSFAT